MFVPKLYVSLLDCCCFADVVVIVIVISIAVDVVVGGYHQFDGVDCEAIDCHGYAGCLLLLLLLLL